MINLIGANMQINFNHETVACFWALKVNKKAPQKGAFHYLETIFILFNHFLCNALSGHFCVVWFNLCETFDTHQHQP
jgi:hypothetical protein